MKTKKLKEHLLATRVTEDEMKLVKKLARKQRLTVSKYLRLATGLPIGKPIVVDTKRKAA